MTGVLDKEWCLARSQKAAQMSAEKRRQRTMERDRYVRLAYAWLANGGLGLTKAETIEAVRWLQEQGQGVNMPDDGTGAYLRLAQITNLSKQRIHAIVTKKRSSVDAKNKG